MFREWLVPPDIPLERIERPCPSWTVGRANRVMHHDRDDRIAAAELGVPALSASWREALSKRADS